MIEGLDDLDGFECVADPTRGAMDQQKVERGIVARVTAILRRTPVRAILCECTELPAFSDALRTATSLPVFDVVTCLDFFHSARNRSFHSAVRHHVTQGIERKLSSEAETAVLPPVRTATNTLRDDARAITRNQLELALGAVNYFERELLIDPLESEVSDVTGRNVTATVWSRLQMLARVVPLLRGATTTETINEVPLATLNIDVADLWKSYLPLALALHKKRQAHAAAQAAAGTDEAFVVGLNAPPGCGKSTLVQLLRTLLRAAAANDDDGRQGSLVVAHVGSDDLYMTQEQRREAGIPSRLDARSIDGSLADSVLWALKRSTAESEVAIPRFNKGLDEREDPKLWTVQRGKVDVVLFEGWRVGVNHPAYARFNEAIDLLVCLDADEEAIKEWKVQSSRRDAVVAGKPFDEAAVRRAFDELIMPFVTIYEKPLLARADLVLKKSATHAIQRFDRSLVQKLEAIADRALQEGGVGVGGDDGWSEPATPSSTGLLVEVTHEGGGRLPLSLVEETLSTLQLRSASRWVWELLARRGVRSTLTKEQFVSTISAAIDSSTAAGAASFWFRQPRVRCTSVGAGAEPSRFRCASGASRLRYTADAAEEAAAAVRAALGTDGSADDVTLLVAFATATHDAHQLRASLRRLFPRALLHGCTSCGGVMSEGAAETRLEHMER